MPGTELRSFYAFIYPSYPYKGSTLFRTATTLVGPRAKRKCETLCLKITKNFKIGTTER